MKTIKYYVCSICGEKKTKDEMRTNKGCKAPSKYCKQCYSKKMHKHKQKRYENQSYVCSICKKEKEYSAMYVNSGCKKPTKYCRRCMREKWRADWQAQKAATPVYEVECKCGNVFKSKRSNATRCPTCSKKFKARVSQGVGSGRGTVAGIRIIRCKKCGYPYFETENHVCKECPDDLCAGRPSFEAF